MNSTPTFITALLLAPLAVLHAAELRLPSIFSDHMVLQSGTSVPVWGWADEGEGVVVEFDGQSKTTTANADGKWTVKLNADQRKFMAASRAPEELYDLQADPFELNNLAEDPRHRTTLDRLRAVLASWLKDTHDESSAPEDPVELEAQLKNLEKVVSGQRQNLGLNGLLESVPGAPEKKD